MILKKAHCSSGPPILANTSASMCILPPLSWPRKKGGQRTGGKEHSYVSESRSAPVCPLSPDMQTAEGGKENPRSEGQRNGQEHCQELVDHVFADFKEGMAANPHFVKGVRGHGLCDHILEAHLRGTRRGDPELSIVLLNQVLHPCLIMSLGSELSPSRLPR